MGLEVFKDILIGFIESFINDSYNNGITVVTFVTSILDTGNVFLCENAVNEWFHIDVSKVEASVFGVAYWFLLLKFVWKGFNIYMLAVDGDEDSDPMVLLSNFIKAIVISVGFGILFEQFMSIGFDILNRITNSLPITKNFPDTVSDLVQVVGASLFLTILGAVYVIMVVYLTIKFMMNALQLVILRVGITFAASGLLDSDQGVFKPYVKKFFQITWTVILQMVCFKLSVLALANANIIPCIMVMAMAIKAPQFLSEFIMTNQGGGGKLQQALYSFSIMRSFAR